MTAPEGAALEAKDGELERLREALDAVIQLHQSRDEQGYAADCCDMKCGHEGECPTVTFQVCGLCALISNGGELWDTFIPGDVLWPCETARAAALAPSTPGEGE